MGRLVEQGFIPFAPRAYRHAGRTINVFVTLPVNTGPIIFEIGLFAGYLSVAYKDTLTFLLLLVFLLFLPQGLFGKRLRQE